LDDVELPEDLSFIDWVEDLGRKGLKVDGNPFTLEDRGAARFLYELIPASAAEARRRRVVVMKGAQLGMTVWEMLALIYMLLKWGRCWVGSFVPDRTLAAVKSSRRLLPILRAIPEAYARLTEVADSKKPGASRGEGNVMTRQIGENMLFFLWTSGKVSTESNPMDVVSFDEVQEMLLGEMEKTLERLSGSRIGFVLMLSTAKWPDADIDYHYRRGTRHRFHHACGCEGGVVLDDYVLTDRIECVGFDDAVGDYQYQCPLCKTFIHDNQAGTWVAEDPGGEYVSVHFPQTLSPQVTPREFLTSFAKAQDKQSWFNRKAGKPYADPSQIPITDAVLHACVEAGAQAGVVWEQSGSGYYMGIDQMGVYSVVIIRKRLADGRGAVVHVEEIRTADPFARCDVLMDLYGVAMCVVESLPNYNDAQRFASRHKGRAFLASYGDLGEDMLRWGDEVNVSTSDRKTDKDLRTRYTVVLDQYKMMQIAMRRMVDKQLLFANPDALVAESIVKGVQRPVAVLREVVWEHFKRTALVVEDDPETRKKRRKVIKVGIDPHFSYANMLCDAVWVRSHGTSLMYWIDNKTPIPDPMQAIQNTIMQSQTLPDGCCGKCSAWKAGWCSHRELKVKERAPGCGFFIARAN